jgi:hypothetical protein
MNQTLAKKGGVEQIIGCNPEGFDSVSKNGQI